MADDQVDKHKELDIINLPSEGGELGLFHYEYVSDDKLDNDISAPRRYAENEDQLLEDFAADNNLNKDIDIMLEPPVYQLVAGHYIKLAEKVNLWSSTQRMLFPLQVFAQYPRRSKDVANSRVFKKKNVPPEKKDGKTLLIFDSSFNPPTRAHAEIVIQAVRKYTDPRAKTEDITQRILEAGGSAWKQRNPWVPDVLLLWSTKNVDKHAQLPTATQRLCMMYCLAYRIYLSRYFTSVQDHVSLKPDFDLGITNSAKFVDKHQEVEKFYNQYYDKRVWLIGSDTLFRIFDSKYYQGEDYMKIIYETILSANDRIFVLLRDMPDYGTVEEQRVKIAALGPSVSEKIDIMEENPATVNCSSTLARTAVRGGDGHALRNLLDTNMIQLITNQGLYYPDAEYFVREGKSSKSPVRAGRWMAVGPRHIKVRVEDVARDFNFPTRSAYGYESMRELYKAEDHPAMISLEEMKRQQEIQKADSSRDKGVPNVLAGEAGSSEEKNVPNILAEAIEKNKEQLGQISEVREAEAVEQDIRLEKEMKAKEGEKGAMFDKIMESNRADTEDITQGIKPNERPLYNRENRDVNETRKAKTYSKLRDGQTDKISLSTEVPKDIKEDGERQRKGKQQRSPSEQILRRPIKRHEAQIEEDQKMLMSAVDSEEPFVVEENAKLTRPSAFAELDIDDLELALSTDVNPSTEAAKRNGGEKLLEKDEQQLTSTLHDHELASKDKVSQSQKAKHPRVSSKRTTKHQPKNPRTLPEVVFQEFLRAQGEKAAPSQKEIPINPYQSEENTSPSAPNRNAANSQTISSDISSSSSLTSSSPSPDPSAMPTRDKTATVAWQPIVPGRTLQPSTKTPGNFARKTSIDFREDDAEKQRTRDPDDIRKDRNRHKENIDNRKKEVRPRTSFKTSPNRGSVESATKTSSSPKEDD